MKEIMSFTFSGGQPSACFDFFNLNDVVIVRTVSNQIAPVCQCEQCYWIFIGISTVIASVDFPDNPSPFENQPFCPQRFINDGIFSIRCDNGFIKAIPK